MTPDSAAAIKQAFPGLPQEELDAMATVARAKTYPAGVILCHEGRLEDTFYIIVSGQGEVCKEFDSDTQPILHRPGPGEFFGEIALVQKSPRTATVRTLTPMTVLEIDKETFDAMLERSPQMTLQIVRQVSSRLRDSDQKAIADLRQKNVELAKAYADLEKQQRLRSDFLTTVAHELRTPLTTITGYLHLIRHGKLNPDHKTEVMETVTNNVDTVVHLVNSILFLQELELITPVFQPVDLGDVALQAIQAMRAQAAKSGIRLQVAVEPGLPTVQGDVMELKRAVQILLDNAIKFSPDGGEIHVTVVRSDGYVGIRVSDPGVGIPADELERIFEPFTQARHQNGHLFGGIGLGLPIAQHVAELHGGHIDVTSQVEEGSTFTLFLPFT